MVDSLTEEEKEIAARSSYKYFVVATTSAEAGAFSKDGKSVEQYRDEMALAMAKRYLIAEKGKSTSALSKMRETIKYRLEVNVDAMRRCCYEKGDGNKALADMRAMLNRQFRNPCIFLRGYDKNKSVVFHVHVAEKGNFHPTDFVKMHVYLGDRASACTERMSGGKESKWTTILNYNGFSYTNCPSLGVTKDLLNCLRDHFPERMGSCYLVDAPFIFRAFWKAVYPFIDPLTRSKITFVSGEREKRAKFGDVLDPNQSMPFANPEGTLTEPVEIKKFLYDTPYDHAYGE